MSSDDGLPPVAETVRKYGLDARKSLGQHFLFDLNLTRRIARNGGDLATGTTIEVGPGPGGLTRALLMEGATRVIAIERDARTLPALAEIAAAYPGKLEIFEGDALAVDAAAMRSSSVYARCIAIRICARAWPWPHARAPRNSPGNITVRG
ncbi:MAG: hypothetical protein JNJ97_11260 [Alphaproteobacteria bacterium]|nr:hypothetical protein [Alphaproteobacteria bacterium]